MAVNPLSITPAVAPRRRVFTPLEKVAAEYLDQMEVRGLTQRYATLSRAAITALIAVARERGHTAWRNVGPATVGEYLEKAPRSHRGVLQTFFLWLARADHPVVTVLDWFGRGRWKRPTID